MLTKFSIRSMYQAPHKKVLLQVDLSQAESWIVAFKANEPNMKKALLYGDIHTQTAGSALFNTNPLCEHDWEKDTRRCKQCGVVIEKSARYIGKRYNHASAYRMGAERAAEVINKDSDKPPYVTVTVAESKQFNKAWHSYYNLKNWWDEIERTLSLTRTITTVYGRSRTFFAQWGNELFKEATAFEPQSTVGDHFNGAIHPELGIEGGLIEIYEQLVVPYFCGDMWCTHETCHKLVNQSHDSCILEVPLSVSSEILERTKAFLFRPLVVNGEQFSIPVDGEIGTRWGEFESA